MLLVVELEGGQAQDTVRGVEPRVGNGIWHDRHFVRVPGPLLRSAGTPAVAVPGAATGPSPRPASETPSAAAPARHLLRCCQRLRFLRNYVHGSPALWTTLEEWRCRPRRQC